MSAPGAEQIALDFDGKTYNRPRDCGRLNKQLVAVREIMEDGLWHTLGEIADRTANPESSVSARLRDLRKPRFGLRTIERRYVSQGLWEYRMEIAR